MKQNFINLFRLQISPSSDDTEDFFDPSSFIEVTPMISESDLPAFMSPNEDLITQDLLRKDSHQNDVVSNSSLCSSREDETMQIIRLGLRSPGGDTFTVLDENSDFGGDKVEKNYDFKNNRELILRACDGKFNSIEGESIHNFREGRAEKVCS